MSRRIVGVILAGGKSQRMGQDKAFLEIEGIPIVERELRVLRSLFPTVAIVAKEPEKFHFFKQATLVRDFFPDFHPLVGVYTALSYFAEQDCFIFSCDLPFLNPDLIHAMIQEGNGWDLLVPKSPRGLEPLHALYAKSALDSLKHTVFREKEKLQETIQGLRMKVFGPETLRLYDPEGLALLNVNTLEDVRVASLELKNRGVRKAGPERSPLLL